VRPQTGQVEGRQTQDAGQPCSGSGGTDHVVMTYSFILSFTHLVHSGHSMINKLKDKDKEKKTKPAAHQLYGKLWLSASCDWSL